MSMPRSLAKFGVMCWLAGSALVAPQPALGQSSAVPQTSHPVVQTVPGDKGMRLNAALSRLGRNPQDADALIEAGEASLGLGDVQAAIGFFQRAGTLAPGNTRARAGLAGAYVLSKDPFTAIPLFEEAARAGPLDASRLADRGLAYDLVGDNSTAQGYYRQSLAIAPSDEALRRLAMSQAIAGDRKAMEVTLSPLLQSQDKSAWRTRAFGLAILGNPEEAESIARQTMPGPMANSMSAYLRYMPKLTAAQQAAAGNLGIFPRAAQIGQDDPRVALYARPKPALAATAPAAVLAKAEPARRTGRPSQPERAASSAAKSLPPLAAAAATKPEPRPAPPPEPKVERLIEAAPVQLASAAPLEAELPPVAKAADSAPSPATVRNPVSAQVAQTAPGLPPFDLAKNAGAQSAPAAAQAKAAQAAPASPPAPAPAPPPTAKRPSLDDAFADLSRPSLEIEPKAGAVDLRKLKPGAAAAKDKPKTPAELAKEAKDKAKAAKVPPPPSHPSRIWVQVATGRGKKALALDWNKMVKADPAVFKARKSFISAWGQTNRLLTGPFETEAAAKAYVAQLKKAGVGGPFMWLSPAGQVVDTLPAAK